jgi:ABC-type dipeptide/oligopeptide/nickel transport system ATPase component
MAEKDYILKVTDLKTEFKVGKKIVHAVNGVSFNVPQNATVGVVGESGCGKSVTSMSIMQLLQGPQGQIYSGSIRFKACDYRRDAKGRPIATGTENGKPVYETEEKVYDNEEIKLLLSAMNIVPGKYDAKKLRYGKLAICTDADSDRIL